MKKAIMSLAIICFMVCFPTISAYFDLTIYADENGPIAPGTETRLINGYAFYTQDGLLKRYFPGTYFWFQYSISIEEKPEWAVVTINPSESLLSHNSTQDIKIVVSVKDTAPAYEYGLIKLDIEAGLYGRNKPIGKLLLPTFPLDQEVTIQAGYLPFLSTTSSPVKQGKPNAQITHMITLTNSGNARSKLDFTVSIPESKLEKGWSAQKPTTVYLEKDATIQIPFTVVTPNYLGFIDDWAQISLDVTVSSPLEPESNTATFSIPTTSHCVGYFVPGIPGGNNPVIIVVFICAIIVSILVFIRYGLSYLIRK